MSVTGLIKLIAAAAANVSQPFFMVKTTYSPGIVRERVFCYELYHKLRLEMGDDHPLTLNGEIDKSGHVDFAVEDQLNPDFIFHIQGQHRGNIIVMEVKGLLSKNIIKDFETLITFIKAYHYRAGVFLLYNYSMNQLINALRRYGINKRIAESETGGEINLITLSETGAAESINCKSFLKN